MPGRLPYERLVLTNKGLKMKKLALIITLSCLTAACQTMKGIGDDISNIDMPAAPKMEAAAASNPNATTYDAVDAKGTYKEPEAPAANEQEVDIKRDFPSYHTAPRFDQEPASK